MSSKDGVKLSAALLMIGVAVALFVYRTREAAEADEESRTHWYCTKTNQAFDIHGDDYDKHVRTGRKPPSKSSRPTRSQGPGVIVTQALSPYTNDWTGIPAAKCGDCGEVYALDPESETENLCPKCQWNPNTGKKGPSPTESSGEIEESN